MLDKHYAVLGALVDLVGTSRYAWLTYQGRIKPNRVTWAVWALAPLVAFAASFSEGVHWASALTLAAGVACLLVIAASVFRGVGYWKLGRFDYACGLLSVAALVLWVVTSTADIGILFAVLADALAALPTIRKAYVDPASESMTPYAAGVLAGVITVASIQDYNFANLAFPMYVTAVSAIIAAQVWTGRALASLNVPNGNGHANGHAH